MTTQLRRSFPPTPDAVSEARAFLQEVLPGTVGEDAAADLSLALSELVTNAVQHAGTPFDVVVETNGAVWVGVEDASPRPPVPQQAEPSALGGRGLALVAALCDRWGVHVVEGAKCVWCERDLPA